MPDIEEKFLQEINDLIQSRLSLNGIDQLLIPANEHLLKAAGHLCISSLAKRIRPLMCLYHHWLLCEEFDEGLVKIGVAAEFIHAASLIHDDIVDNAEKRRGKPSVNGAYGNNIAVLAGDFLLTEAFDLIKTFDRRLTDIAIDVIKAMTRSAMKEVLSRGNVDLREEDWRVIAAGKTGALFSWCSSASFLSKNDKAPNNLLQTGTHIGLIFQMADDLKDLSGDRDLKDLCRDIRNKELSLPIILAINENENIKMAFKEIFALDYINNDQVESLKDMVLNSSAITKTKYLMEQEIMSLKSLLNSLKKNAGRIRIEQWMEGLIGQI